jgi:hypothetical protein
MALKARRVSSKLARKRRRFRGAGVQRWGERRPVMSSVPAGGLISHSLQHLIARNERARLFRLDVSRLSRSTKPVALACSLGSFALPRLLFGLNPPERGDRPPSRLESAADQSLDKSRSIPSLCRRARCVEK